MCRGLVTAVDLACRKYNPSTLDIAIRYLEHGPQKLGAPHLKDSQIISII